MLPWRSAVCSEMGAPDKMYAELDWIDLISSPYDERRRSQSGREARSSSVTFETGFGLAEARAHALGVEAMLSLACPSVSLGSLDARGLCRLEMPPAMALRPPVEAVLRTSAHPPSSRSSRSSEPERDAVLGSTSSPRGSSVGSSSRATASDVGLRPDMVVMLEATLSRLSLLASRHMWVACESCCT